MGKLPDSRVRVIDSIDKDLAILSATQQGSVPADLSEEVAEFIDFVK